MSLEPAPAPHPVLGNYDRRRYRRYPISLLGRYMLEDRREYPCRTIDVSPDSVALGVPVAGRIGERIVAYIDHIGRIEGELTRLLPDGFSMSVSASLRKRDKLAATLAWLADRDNAKANEDRRNGRVIPKNPFSSLVLPDGQYHRCRILDLSLSGAALSIAIQPPVGTPVSLGLISARIVRHFEGGLAIEFARTHTEDDLSEHF